MSWYFLQDIKMMLAKKNAKYYKIWHLLKYVAIKQMIYHGFQRFLIFDILSVIYALNAELPIVPFGSSSRLALRQRRNWFTVLKSYLVPQACLSCLRQLETLTQSSTTFSRPNFIFFPDLNFVWKSKKTLIFSYWK